MEHFAFLSHFIGGAVGSTTLLVLAIIVGVLVLEDTTVIIVGILAADHIIPLPIGLGALYVGILISDIGLYTLGYLASRHSRFARYVDHKLVAPFRAWLETRFVLTIFTARFIPGARLPTFTSTGFFRSSLSKFVSVAVGATLVWTTTLFTAAYWFGNATSAWMGPARWGIAAAFLIALFFFARHNILAYRTSKNNLPDTPVDLPPQA